MFHVLVPYCDSTQFVGSSSLVDDFDGKRPIHVSKEGLELEMTEEGNKARAEVVAVVRNRECCSYDGLSNLSMGLL